MGLLRDDLADSIATPLGKLYDVTCITKAGGFCCNSAADHLRELPVFPGVTFKQLWPVIRDQIKAEAEPYAAMWHPEGINIKTLPDIFEQRKVTVKLIFGDITVAVYTLRELNNEHSF